MGSNVLGCSESWAASLFWKKKTEKEFFEDVS